MGSSRRQAISAVLMARDRAEAVGTVLDRLRELPVDEVVVVDNGSTDGTPEVVEARQAQWSEPRRLVLLRQGANIGVAARNIAIEQATGDLLLLVDDDSYPLPGSIEALVAAFEANPRSAVVAGMVVELDEGGAIKATSEPGSFDWMMRAGAEGDAPPAGFPTYFFPEGAAMARRAALLEVGGYFEGFFFTHEGFELTARLIGAGWDVRYCPAAPFHHMGGARTKADFARTLRLSVRNQLWYFWLHFPLGLAVRRMPAYALYDLVQCLYRRVPGAWAGGVVDAWRQRSTIRGMRKPLPRQVVQRVELTRGRAHVRLLALMPVRLARRIRGRRP